MTAFGGIPGRPMTGLPPIIEAENWSKTFGFIKGRSERRSPSKTGLAAAWTFVAMMGGSCPWKVTCGESALTLGDGLGGFLLRSPGGKIISGALLSLRRSPPPRNRWSNPVNPCCGRDCCGAWGRFITGLRSICCCGGLGRFSAGLTFWFFSCSSCWRRCCSEDSCSPGCPAGLRSWGPWGACGTWRSKSGLSW